MRIPHLCSRAVFSRWNPFLWSIFYFQCVYFPFLRKLSIFQLGLCVCLVLMTRSRADADVETVFSLIISARPSVQTQDCQASWRAKNVSQSGLDLPLNLTLVKARQDHPVNWARVTVSKTCCAGRVWLRLLWGKSKKTRLYYEVGQR